jgi:hypothetical protein
MKPRIRMDKGVWCCGRPYADAWGWFSWPVGHGYSPRDAYNDWAAQL